MDIKIDIETILAVRKLLGIVNRASYSGRTATRVVLANQAVAEMRELLKDEEMQTHLKVFNEAALRARVFKAEKAKGPDPKFVARQKEILELTTQIYNARKAWLEDTSMDSDKYFKDEEALMEKLYTFNDLSIDENTPLGRIHMEGQGDGYAVYICTDINDQGEVHMTHVSSGDAWTSPMIEKCHGWVRSQILNLKRHSRDNLFGRSSRASA